MNLLLVLLACADVPTGSEPSSARDGCADPVWRDADADGWGDAATPGCGSAAGWVHNDDDCDDADRGRYPNARETCDGVDEDCDGGIDDHAADAVAVLPDADGDGYGVWDDPNVGVGDFECPGTAGWTVVAGDCDDADPAVHRDATDVCGDARDDDCVEGCAPVVRPSAAAIVLQGAPASLLRLGDVDGDGFLDVVGVSPDGTAAWFGPFAGRQDGVATASHRIVDWPAALALGDLDGDGLDDGLFGLPGAVRPEGWGTPSGAVELHLSDGRAGWKTPSAWHGSEGDQFGAALAVFPSEGVVLIGAPGAGANGEAQVRAYGGGGGVTWTGSRYGFGRNLTNAGDLDGDGLDDAAVNGWYAVTVWTGPIGLADRDETDADATIAPTGPGFREGGPWAAGDVDGDGYDDVLLPPILTSDPGGFVGLLDGGVLGERSAADAVATLHFDYAPQTSAAAADLDGDGRSDLVVGEPGFGPEHSGAVYVVLGPASGAVTLADDAERRFVGDVPRTYAGRGVAAGDLDADGRAEVVFGVEPSYDIEAMGLYAFSW